MPLDSEFVKISASKLRKMLEKIEACAARLTPQQIWTRASDNENAVGNLMLHLNGNVRQWIISGVGGAEDTRVRDWEFSNREAIPTAQLAARLRATVEEAVRVIEGLCAEQLMQPIRVQNFDVSRMEAVYHVVEHFAGHTFQIIFATKLLTGQDVGLTRLPAPAAAGEKTP